MKSPTKKRSPRSSRATATRRIAPEDLLRFRLVAGPRIAPDGDRVVFEHVRVGDRNQYVRSLWMVGTAPRAAAAPFTSGERDAMPRWSPDGRSIAFVRATEKEKPQVHLIEVDGGEARPLTELPEGVINALEFSPDGRTLAVSFREQDARWTTDAAKERTKSGESDPPWVVDDWWYRLDGDGYFGAQRFRLLLVDVATGAHRTVYKRDRLGFFTFDFSPDSRKLAITTNQDRKAMIRPWKEKILVLDLRSGRTREVPGLPDGPKTCVKWSPDGGLLAYAGRAGRDGAYGVENMELWVCDPSRGRPRNLTGDEDHCLMAAGLTDTAEVRFEPTICWSHDARRVFVKIGRHGESHVAAVSVRGGPLVFLTRGTADYDPGNLSRDGKRMAMTKSTSGRLAEVHVGDVSARSLRSRALTKLNAPLLAELDLAAPEPHRIRTADGTKVQLWVMLPPGHAPGSPRRYPGILEIHGGPHAQYSIGFFHELQVLAASGYAVVFSNPRGSKGYGRDHCAAIRGKWGDKDWVDVQAVTEFMQSHPNIDRRRLGVMGGSYGGYMTNWVIGHTDAFAAAITDRCVSNIVTMDGTSDYVEKPGEYFPGNSWSDTAARWDQSPMKHIGNARTPTLIIHSEGDLRCNIEQAEQLFTALKHLNVPTRLVRYPRSTSHGMSRGGPPDLRLHRLAQILDWWAMHLG